MAQKTSLAAWAALSIALLNLQGCSETIDAGQASVVNSLWYRAGKPFSGTIENIKTEFYGQYYIGGACSIEVSKGRLDGKLECRHRDGFVDYLMFYKNGQQDGIEERHDFKTAKLIIKANWKDGEKDGLEENYDAETGKLTAKINWSNGVKVGKEVGWDSSGTKVIADLEWKNGLQTGFDNRHMTKDVSYKDGKLHGIQKSYYDQGFGKGINLEVIENYTEGMRDGSYKVFDEKGRLCEESIYQKGKHMSRVRQSWDAQGNMIERIVEDKSAAGVTPQ